MYGLPSRVDTQRICVHLGILEACLIIGLIPNILLCSTDVNSRGKRRKYENSSLKELSEWQSAMTM